MSSINFSLSGDVHDDDEFARDDVFVVDDVFVGEDVFDGKQG